MTVKETYCSVTNLVPNTQYEFWVTAQNRAGSSPTSERAVYMTGKGAHLCLEQDLDPRGPGSPGFLAVAGPLTSFGRAGIPVCFSFTEYMKSLFLVWKGHLLRVGLKISKSNHSGIEPSNLLLLLECGKGMPCISVRLGGHNRAAWTKGLIHDRHYCSGLQRLEGPGSRSQHIQRLPRSLPGSGTVGSVPAVSSHSRKGPWSNLGSLL